MIVSLVIGVPYSYYNGEASPLAQGSFRIGASWQNSNHARSSHHHNRSASTGEPKEVLDPAFEGTGRPANRVLSGDGPNEVVRLCPPGRGGPGAVACRSRVRHFTSRWKLASRRENDRPVRSSPAALAARLEDGISARFEARYGSGQRPGIRRGAVCRILHPRPANGWAARSLPLGVPLSGTKWGLVYGLAFARRCLNSKWRLAESPLDLFPHFPLRWTGNFHL